MLNSDMFATDYKSELYNFKNRLTLVYLVDHGMAGSIVRYGLCPN